MISIITVNYNSTRVTVDLLRSIQSLGNDLAEVIVVDNGSGENPRAFLEAWFPWVKFIRSEKNLGFAGGNNLGLAHATGEYLFFVNNDTEFRTNILPALVTDLEKNPSLGVVCPVLRYYDHPSKIQFAGYTSINKVTGRNRCITALPPVGNHPLIETEYAHGAAMMIRRKVIDTAGAMPENYFLYYEELDWCERIKEAGYTIAVDPNVVLYHKESMTVGAINELKSYFMSRNRILFMRRNSTTWQQLLFWIYFLSVATPASILGYSITQRWKNIRAHLAGILWNFKQDKNCTVIGYKFNYLKG